MTEDRPSHYNLAEQISSLRERVSLLDQSNKSLSSEVSALKSDRA